MADLDGLREEWFLRMLAPPPAAREISVEGARILADTYRDLVGAHHDRVLAAVGRSLAETQGVCSRACPLDLHALVPDAVLQLGPDDPASLDWLWTHWGTTRALRHVALLPADDRRLRRSAQVGYRFFCADWMPWRAVQTLRLRALPGFDVKPDYGNQDRPTTADAWFKDPAGRKLEGRDRSAAPNRKRLRKAPAQTRMRRRTTAS